MRLIPNAIIVLVAASLSGCKTVNLDVTNNFGGPALILVQSLNSAGDDIGTDEHTVPPNSNESYTVELAAGAVQFNINALNTIKTFAAPSANSSVNVTITIMPDGSAEINASAAAHADDESPAESKGSFRLPTLDELLPIPFLESDDGYDRPLQAPSAAAARPRPTRGRD